MQDISSNPEQQISIAVGLLQLIATFSLVWVAGAKYMFSMYTSIRSQPSESDFVGVPYLALKFYTTGIWSSGLGLSLTLLVVTSQLSEFVNSAIEASMIVMSMIAIVAWFGVVYLSVDEMGSLRDEGILTQYDTLYPLAGTVVFVVIVLFVFGTT